jgi:hypothetical protein
MNRKVSFLNKIDNIILMEVVQSISTSLVATLFILFSITNLNISVILVVYFIADGVRALSFSISTKGLTISANTESLDIVVKLVMVLGSTVTMLILIVSTNINDFGITVLVTYLIANGMRAIAIAVSDKNININHKVDNSVKT